MLLVGWRLFWGHALRALLDHEKHVAGQEVRRAAPHHHLVRLEGARQVHALAHVGQAAVGRQLARERPAGQMRLALAKLVLAPEVQAAVLALQ